MADAAQAKYDVVIIGAGIGGLVCGCYLAKAGMRVLVVEQHHKPGGYCASFKRKHFLFDAAAHSFGGFRQNGTMRKILEELGVEINIQRFDPSDIILAPDRKVAFGACTESYKNDLQNNFPLESQGITLFLDFLQSAKPLDFVPLRKLTFKEFLDRYFSDEQLKAMLGFPVLGNGGLPPSQISAFTGTKIYIEFLLDGGYYPDGGMQNLANALARTFNKLGGQIRLSTPANKIIVDSGRARGIMLNNSEFIPAKYVVSNCDARQTFIDLLDAQVVNKSLLVKINSMRPSLSVFVAYLGVDDALGDVLPRGVNIWIMPHYDIEAMYSMLCSNILDFSGGFMMRLSPDGRSLQAFVNAPYISENFWVDNKNRFLDRFIERLDYHIPGLSKHLVYKDAGSPRTMRRYTRNYAGAAYGWAAVPSQLFDAEMSAMTVVQGLFLCGHWTTETQGIPGVAYLGYETAKKICKINKGTL